jgi:pimeloyl-ACP methyl ester carboxylesterase
MDDAAIWRTPAGVRRAFVDGRYGQVHLRHNAPATASRRPLLLLHSTGFSGRMFAGLLSELARDRLAIAPDAPGYGESDPPPAPTTIAEIARVHGELLDTLGLAEVDVLGYHGGTKTAVEIALQRPNQVRRVVLCGTPVAIDDERPRQRLGFQRSDFSRDGGHLQRRWQWAMPFRRPDVPLICLQKSLAETLRPGPRAWWGGRANYDYRLETKVPALAQPHLVLNPDDDLTSQTRRLQAALGTKGRFRELPEWAHWRLDTRAPQFAAWLREFLDETGAGPAALNLVASAKPPYTVQRRFVHTPAGRVHLRMATPEFALARPLVLLHLSSLSSRVYEALVPEMGRDRVTVALDTPGFGESEAPAAQPTIEEYAATVGAAIDALGLGAVDVMGYHTGSVIAVELARQRPTGVGRVVMISAPIFTPPEIEERLVRNGPEAIAEDGSHLAERWRRMTGFYHPRVADQIIERNFAEALRGGPMTHWGHYAVYKYPLADRLSGVTQPLLILRPDDDAAALTLRANGLLRNGRILDCPDYGFDFLDTRTREVAAT